MRRKQEIHDELLILKHEKTIINIEKNLFGIFWYTHNSELTECQSSIGFNGSYNGQQFDTNLHHVCGICERNNWSQRVHTLLTHHRLKSSKYENTVNNTIPQIGIGCN